VAAERIPGKRIVRGLIPVFRFAWPHAGGLILAISLMAVQAGANVGRIVLIYPILDRVLQPEIPSGAGAEGGEGALAETQQAIKSIRKRASSFVVLLDDITSRANAATGKLIPEGWLDDVAPPDDTSEAAQAARAVRLDQYATLLSVLFVFLLFIAVMCVAAYAETYVATKVQLHILMDIREALCRKLLDQPVGFYDSRQRGELVQRVLGDVGGCAIALNLILNGLIRGLLHIFASLVFLLLLSWQLSLVCMLGLPFLLPMRSLMRRTLRRAHKRQQEGARLIEVLLQIFSGIRTVKAFGTEERRVREFRQRDEKVTQRSLKVQRAKSTTDALTAFINNALAMLLAVGGGFAILRFPDVVNPVSLVLFLFLIGNLYHPIKRIVKQFAHLQDAMASVERTNEYLELPAGSPDRPDAVAFAGLQQTIRFEHLSFAYVPGTPVLEDVSFEIPKGHTVALVGPSGGGKSTLCDLLLRFYDPTEGRITLDGRDARDYTRASLLDRTAVVTQVPFLFHTTIRDNIRQGRFSATDAQVEEAAKAAQIHEFIARLPRGYEDEVGEAGVRLSGGQRQRITIARALVRNPDILVLDEATSSLDTSSEKLVQAALDTLQEGRTTLVVAHRLSTVRHADRIVVVDQGRVVDEGTHEELLQRGGLYAHLVQMQDLGVPS